MINWWVYIPMAIFLAFSVVAWRMVKHADPVSTADGASPAPAERAAVAQSTEHPAEGRREAA